MAINVVDLWTDGSGTVDGRPGGWAYVLVWVHPNTGQVHELEGSGQMASATNNQAELTAVIEGFRAIKRTSLVVVHSDSEYIIRAFNEGWITKWEDRRWAKVKNADLWKQLIVEVKRHMVAWEWVKGHSGEKYNERCDKLAGEARRKAIEAVKAGELKERAVAGASDTLF